MPKMLDPRELRAIRTLVRGGWYLVTTAGRAIRGTISRRDQQSLWKASGQIAEDVAQELNQLNKETES